MGLRRLRAVTEVLPGFSTGSALSHDPAGTHQLVQSRHLKPGLPYHFQPEDAVRFTPSQVVERYLLRMGDVLFMSRGTRNVASWLASIPHPSLAAPSFYIVRPGPELDSSYLCWYLNQPAMQRQLAEIRTGAGAPIIQRSAFQELMIPVPPSHEQQRIGALGELMAREQLLLLELERTTDTLHDATSVRIAQMLSRHATHTEGAIA